MRKFDRLIFSNLTLSRSLRSSKCVFLCSFVAHFSLGKRNFLIVIKIDTRHDAPADDDDTLICTNFLRDKFLYVVEKLSSRFVLPVESVQVVVVVP